MNRREMCTFNEIFCDNDGVMSEEDLAKKYGDRSLASAVRKRIDEILWPYMKMALKGGDKYLELDEETREAIRRRCAREAVYTRGGDSKKGEEEK